MSDSPQRTEALNTIARALNLLYGSVSLDDRYEIAEAALEEADERGYVERGLQAKVVQE